MGSKHKAGWHPDEQIVVGVNGSLAANHFDTDMGRAPIPEGLQWARYNFSSYFYISYIWYQLAAPVAQVLHSTEHQGSSSPLLLYRQFSAALALLTCLFVYGAARAILTHPFALLAVLFTGVLPLLVQDAHYARAEAFVTAGATGVLWLGIVMIYKCSARLCFASGLLVGVLAACKVSLAPLLLVPFLAVLACHKQSLRAREWRGARGIGLLMAGFAAGFLLGVPYVLVHARSYWQGWQHLRNQYSHPFEPYGPDPSGYCFGFIARYLTATFGLPLLLLAGIGAFHFFAKQQNTLLLMLAGPLVFYYVTFGFQYAFFERNISHIAPWIAILAATGCMEIWLQMRKVVSTREFRVTVMALAITVTIWVPLTLSWRIAVVVLSGRSYDTISEYEALLSNIYKGLPAVQYDGWSYQFLERIQQYLAMHPAGFILKVGDANDDLSRHRVAIAQRIYNMKLLATVPGRFPDLPTCTLQMYHSQNYSWYLVRPNGI